MMRLPKMDHCAPATVSDVCSLLDEHGTEARLLAGGSDLLAACKLRNLRPSLLVSLGRIPELKKISFQGHEGLRIGAMTSLRDVRYHSSIRDKYRALAQAAEVVGTVQLQAMGTVGGNLCVNTRCIYYNQSESWRRSRAVCFKMGGNVCHVVPKCKKCYAVFSADTPPALIALDAQVKLISSAGERVISLSDLYTGNGKDPLAIRSGEVLTEIRVPEPVGRQSSTYLKYRARGAIDFPLVGVAVRMGANGDGICVDCKVVLNAVGSAPIEVPYAGELLKGKAPTEELISQAAETAAKGAHPVANTLISTTAYRRKMAGILTRRALFATANTLGLV